MKATMNMSSGSRSTTIGMALCTMAAVLMLASLASAEPMFLSKQVQQLNASHMPLRQVSSLPSVSTKKNAPPLGVSDDLVAGIVAGFLVPVLILKAPRFFLLKMSMVGAFR